MNERYQKNKEKYKDLVRKWLSTPRGKELRRISKRKIREKMHSEIIELLGSRCSNPVCPIPLEKMDIKCLQIDHVHGNGNRDRKQFRDRKVYLREILREIKNGSRDFQLLCVYCNFLKSFDSMKRGGPSIE
jgi:hypothetical protein